jgi:luciferase family oxidoreductase group 1
MIPLSILDLTRIREGGDAREALDEARSLAAHAEALGFRRYWLAEHHNMVGIASAATSLAIAHVAAGTTRIRVGAGGIMLPNHAPLVIAEQFGTLARLFPGRIDLGLGRAPGTDGLTLRALRRSPLAADSFPEDVLELMSYFAPAEPGQRVQAVPAAGTAVPLWILGSSTYGAQLAGHFGLPFAFASHFAPQDLDRALELYRQRFRCRSPTSCAARAACRGRRSRTSSGGGRRPRGRTCRRCSRSRSSAVRSESGPGLRRSPPARAQTN